MNIVFFRSLIMSVLCCTTFCHLDTAAQQKDINQVIKNITSKRKKLHASDLNLFAEYFRHHWQSDKTIDEIHRILKDKAIQQQICQLSAHESSGIKNGTITILIAQCPDLIAAIAPSLALSIDQINPTVITELLCWPRDPAILKTLADAVVKSIANIDIRVVEYIAACDSSYILIFLKAAFENKKTSATTINSLLAMADSFGIKVPAQYNIETLKKRIKAFFGGKPLTVTAYTLVMIVLYKHMFGTLPCTLTQLTQTEQHAIANASLLSQSIIFSTLACKEQCLSLLDNITAKERELAKQGYVSFVHGQRWQFQIIEQWYTQLWEVRYQRNVSDYMFIHCITPCDDPKQLEKERNFRKYILDHGRENETIRLKLLFLNYAFFGNEQRLGSSSAEYILNNSNNRSIKVSLKDVFEMLEYGIYYDRYKQELEDLEQEHEALNAYGNLLLLGVPKAILPECVYFAENGGYKKTILIPGHGQTDGILTIIDTLRNHPDRLQNSNLLEFCLILTDDMLTPDSGIKVYSFNMADPIRFAQFQQKSANLFARIKNGIERDRRTRKA